MALPSLCLCLSLSPSFVLFIPSNQVVLQSRCASSSAVDVLQSSLQIGGDVVGKIVDTACMRGHRIGWATMTTTGRTLGGLPAAQRRRSSSSLVYERWAMRPWQPAGRPGVFASRRRLKGSCARCAVTVDRVGDWGLIKQPRRPPGTDARQMILRPSDADRQRS